MAKLVTDGGTRRERDCSAEISESILQGRFTYDKSLGPFFDGALIVNVDRRFLEHFAENACRHQEGRGKMVCRRYMMHYIDIGMDVHGQNPPVIGGQIILSSPGGLCMRCMGFLTDEKLAEEAARYGKAGARPQVVWPNGVLASTAVGLAMDIVTDWTGRPLPHVYLVYDGNKGKVKESLTLHHLNIPACPHFPGSDVGDPVPIEL